MSVASNAPPGTVAPPAPAPGPTGVAHRYQVQAVPWANRMRFVVRDTTTHTTIAIRTTRDVADSDILRLNMAARPGPGTGPHPDSV